MRPFTRPRKNTCALALAAFIATLASASAQTLPSDPVSVSLPAQPLAEAIVSFNRQTGVRVVAPGDLVRGLTSAPVEGTLAPQQALDAMLLGTGLQPTFTSTNEVVLSEMPATVEQGNGAEGTLTTDVIIVRGELIERTLQDSQTSAVIITGDELDQRGETSVAQTLERVPGVHQAGQFTIRGIAEDNGFGNSTLAITTDGIRLSDYRNVSITDISTWDVEQVEVLRGPQSTQSGRNALAGAVIVESVDPSYIPEYKVRAGVTEIERDRGEEGTGYQAAFALNMPIVEDQIAVRLSADRRENLDGENPRQTVRGKLRFDPTEDLSIDVEFTNINNEGFQFLRLNSPSLNIDYDINDVLMFSSRSQYTDANPGFLQSVPSLNVTALRDREYETIEQELQLVYDTEDLRAIAGLFYTNLSENSVLEVNIGAVRSLLLENIKTDNYAIYGEAEYDLSPEWTLIAGLRYDLEQVENTSTASTFFGGFPGGSETGTFDNTYSALLPKAGVVYNFDDDLSLGATYQRGYRAGGGGVTVSPASEPFTFEFDPEFTDTFELALRSQSSDGNRVFNANVFYTRWTDQQVAQRDALGNNFVSNAANSRLWGAEIQYSEFVTDELEFFASAAYVNNRYGDYVLNGVQQAGNQFPFAPEITANFGANYTFSNGLFVSGDVNYTSSNFSDAANTAALENDDYWLVNLNASYIIQDEVELTAYVRNLLDEEYSRILSPTGLNVLGVRREFGLLLNVNF
ncbi:MAG: TonB-dependent receptor [Pseudomonadota bacterium]